MGEAVDRLEAERREQSVTGVVLTSAKKTFFAGGNLNDAPGATADDAQGLFETSMTIKAALRRLETLAPGRRGDQRRRARRRSRSRSPATAGIAADGSPRSGCPR